MDKVSVLDSVGGWISHLFEYVSGSLKDVTFEVFRCSRYHNKYHSCTGHYIKASTVEMLIYQATLTA